jgi:hypothetical protein
MTTTMDVMGWVDGEPPRTGGVILCRHLKGGGHRLWVEVPMEECEEDPEIGPVPPMDMYVCPDCYEEGDFRVEDLSLLCCCCVSELFPVGGVSFLRERGVPACQYNPHP